jgi:hypothetical protein
MAYCVKYIVTELAHASSLDRIPPMRTFVWPLVTALSFASGLAVSKALPAPLYIDGHDPGIHIRMDKTSTEGYYSAFQKNASGHYIKVGVVAFQWTNPRAPLPYASANLHSSYTMANGRTNDDIWIAGWGKHGATFFPPDLSAASAPGEGVVWINGRLAVGQQGKALDFHEEIATLKARIAKLESGR